MNILVIRLSSLGDVILTTPLLASIKAARPESRVSVLVKKAFADVFLGHPAVDEILIFEERGLFGWLGEIRRRRFDVCLDLHDNLRSAVWRTFSGAKRTVRYDKRTDERRILVRSKTSSPRLEPPVKERYLECLAVLGIPVKERRTSLHVAGAARLPEDWLREFGDAPLIGVAPGAAHATKRWLPERFAAAADSLAEKISGRVILLGTPSDDGPVREVLEYLKTPAQNFVGRTSLKEFMLLIRRCAVLLTNDSGAMHVAAAQGVPTAAVFGPTVRDFGFFPEEDCAEAVEIGELYCRPCSLHGTERCPEGHFRCMREISTKQVLDAAERALAKTPKRVLK